MITEPERDADMKFYEDRVRSEYLYTSFSFENLICYE